MAREWHPYIVGHRGAHGVAPENTLPAFHVAANLRLPRVELDVRLTADYQPIVIHNATVDETTNGAGRVDEMTLAEIKELDAAFRWAPSFPNTRIPSLDEVFTTFGNAFHYHVELKIDEQTDIERLVRCIVSTIRLGAIEHVTLTSTSNAALQFAARCCPDSPRGKIITGNEQAADDDINDALVFGCTTVCIKRALLDERTVGFARRCGLFIVGWTANTPEELDEMRIADVDAVSTDRPDIAIDWMGRHGIRPHP